MYVYPVYALYGTYIRVRATCPLFRGESEAKRRDGGTAVTGHASTSIRQRERGRKNVFVPVASDKYLALADESAHRSLPANRIAIGGVVVAVTAAARRYSIETARRDVENDFASSVPNWKGAAASRAPKNGNRTLGSARLGCDRKSSPPTCPPPSPLATARRPSHSQNGESVSAAARRAAPHPDGAPRHAPLRRRRSRVVSRYRRSFSTYAAAIIFQAARRLYVRFASFGRRDGRKTGLRLRKKASTAAAAAESTRNENGREPSYRYSFPQLDTRPGAAAFPSRFAFVGAPRPRRPTRAYAAPLDVVSAGRTLCPGRPARRPPAR